METGRPIQRTAVLAVILCLVGLVAAQSLWAQPRPNVFAGGNRWAITFFNDPATNHQQWATQHICFSNFTTVGTHIQGFWYALTFPNWNGRYTQEGDSVRMHGDYANDVGHDHMGFDLSTMSATDVGMGHWDEWREDGGLGRTIGWGNTRLTRVGCCPGWFCPPAAAAPLVDPDKVTVPGETNTLTEDDAVAISINLPPRLTNDGGEAEDPFDPEQESVEDYLARTGQQQP